jgi:hypothetical protein
VSHFRPHECTLGMEPDCNRRLVLVHPPSRTDRSSERVSEQRESKVRVYRRSMFGLVFMAAVSAPGPCDSPLGGVSS